MSTLTTLYSSDRLAVSRYDCDHQPGQADHEEASEADEFVIPLQGVYRKRSSDGTAVLDPSRLAVFRKGQPYSIDHPVRGGDRSLIVAFAPPDLCAAIGAEPDSTGTLLKGVPGMLVNNPGLMLLNGRLYNAVRQSLQDECQIEELAFELLLRLCEAAGTRHRSASDRFRERHLAGEVSAIVSSRFNERLSIGEVARLLEVSPYHLCRAFRRATGMTIHGQIRLLRMSAAMERLWEYRNNLTHLALELGYSSHSHFSSAFRSFYGLTPSQLINDKGTRPGPVEPSEE